MLQLTLSSAKASYQAGEMPMLSYKISNLGDKLVSYWAYLLEYRLKASLVAENQGKGSSFELQPFHPQAWPDAQFTDTLQIAPGAHWQAPLLWNDPYGFAFVQRHSQPPVIPITYTVKGLPAGQFRMRVYLSDTVSYYVGQDQLFDRRLESRTHLDKAQAPILESEITLAFVS